MLRSVLSTEPWLCGPAVVPIPFRQDVINSYLSRAQPDGSATDLGKPLKLGILWSDGIVGVHPPIRRGLKMVLDSVSAAGHKAVDWNPPPQATARKVHLSFLKADGAHDIHAQLDVPGQPLIPDLRSSSQLQPPLDLLEYQSNTLQGLEYEISYTEYWNGTASEDGEYSPRMPRRDHLTHAINRANRSCGDNARGPACRCHLRQILSHGWVQRRG